MTSLDGVSIQKSQSKYDIKKENEKIAKCIKEIRQKNENEINKARDHRLKQAKAQVIEQKKLNKQRRAVSLRRNESLILHPNKQTPTISMVDWTFPSQAARQRIEKLIAEHIKKFNETLSPKTARSPLMRPYA